MVGVTLKEYCSFNHCFVDVYIFLAVWQTYFLIELIGFMLEMVMEKFQKATKNNMQKFFVDQLQHVTDRIGAKGQ